MGCAMWWNASWLLEGAALGRASEGGSCGDPSEDPEGPAGPPKTGASTGLKFWSMSQEPWLEEAYTWRGRRFRS